MEVSHFFLWIDPSSFWSISRPQQCVSREENSVIIGEELHPQWMREYSPNRAGGEEEQNMELLNASTEYYDRGLVGTQIKFRIDE